MPESLQRNKFQYGARLMTVASRSLGKLGAVNFDSMVEHRGKERFLKNKVSLAAVDSHYGRSCIQKLAMSEQPGTERNL